MEFIENNKTNIAAVQLATIKERVTRGGHLYIAAWGFEIIAAIIGVIVAIVFGHDAYTNYLVVNPEDPSGELIISAAHWADVVLGSMPFLLVALAEILKIPIVYLVYINRNLITKVLFSIILFGLTLITFETVISGFERTFTNVIYKVERPKDQLRQINDLIEMRQEEISITNKITSRSVNKDKQSELVIVKNIYDKAVYDLEDKIFKLLEDINVESNYLKDQLNADIERYEVERATAAQEVRNNYESSKLTREANITKAQEVDDKLINQITKDIEMTHNFISAWDKSAKGSYTKEFCAKDPQCKENYKKISVLEENKNRLRNKQSSDTSIDYFANYQVLKTNVEKNYDKKIKIARDGVRLIENEQNQELVNRQDVKDLREDGKVLDASYENEKKKINASFAKQGEQIGSQKEINEKNKIDLKAMKNKREEIKKEINKYIAVAQIYRFTKYRLNFMADGDVCTEFADSASAPHTENEFSIFNLFKEKQERECLKVKKAKEITIADVTPSEVTRTAFWWYGSLSALVAIMGVVLAFGSFILTHPNENYLNTKRHRLKNTIRRMFISLRKRIREPKIVTKIRIKEVPKEVIKEVLVQKVVLTEVPVEVIKKEVFYEPLYTKDPDLLKFGTAKVRDILNKFGKGKDKIVKKDDKDS